MNAELYVGVVCSSCGVNPVLVHHTLFVDGMEVLCQVCYEAEVASPKSEVRGLKAEVRGPEDEGELRRGRMVGWIEVYVKFYGYAPSRRELAAHFGVSVSTVHRDLRTLREDGVLAFEDWTARSIRLAPVHEGARYGLTPMAMAMYEREEVGA